VAGEEPAGPGEVFAAHRDRAQRRVLVEDGVDRVGQSAVVGQQMSQRGVAVAVFGFGLHHLLVDVDRGVAGLGPQQVQHGTGRVTGQGQQVVHHDQGAGVDERVRWHAAVVLDLLQRIERVAGRLPSDALPDRVAGAAEHQSQGEDLGHALQRERRPAVTDPLHRTVGRGQGQPEPVRIYGGQRGYVVGHSPAPDER